MTMEVPRAADESQVREIERIHEVLLNESGHETDNVLVTLDVDRYVFNVDIGPGVGS